MRFVIAAAVVAASACAKLPDVTTTCGNFVLEAPEDCDAGPSGADWCTADCRLVCQPSGCVDHAGNTLANYHCGIDGLCHAAGGGFPHEAGQFPFTPIAVTASDIDNDGIPDLVGLTLDTEVVRFGDPDGLLQRETVSLIPSSTGQSAFGDLDGDGNADAFVPTLDGLAVMTSSSNIPLPYPFTNRIVGAGSCLAGTQARDVVSLDDTHLVVVVAQGGTLAASVLDIATSACSPTTLQSVCNLPDPGLGSRTSSIVAYDTSAVTTPSTSALVVVSDGMHLCPLTVVMPSTGSAQITAGTAITRTLFNSQPVLAQVDGAVPACPELFAGDITGTWRYAATGGATGCSIATTATALPATLGGGPGIVPAGRARVLPRIANAGPDVLALTNLGGITGFSTIYAFVTPSAMPTTAVLLYQASAAFSSMQSADLDGDGVTEIVTTTRLTSDFQILYRTQAPDGFLIDRVPTEGTPVEIVLRDYDGNGLPDIALVEVLNGDTRVDVAYSTRDRPLPLSPMASFPNGVLALLPVQVADSIDPLEKAEDLAVVQALPTATQGQIDPGLTLLHGGAQRSMFAFFDPRNPLDPNKHAFVAVVSGYFFAPAPTPPAVAPQDVLAFEDVSDASGFSYGWAIDNPGTGTLGTSRGRKAIRGLDYTPMCTAPGATVCGRSANFTTARIGNRDIVLAVDGRHHLSWLDPQAADLAFVDTGVIASMTEPPSDLLVVFRPVTADLDGQGAPELVLPFRSNNYANPDDAVLVVCHLDDTTGVPTSCDNLTGSTGPLAGYHCSDAGAGRLTPRGRAETFGAQVALDLAATCKDGSGTPHLAILRNDNGSLVLAQTLPFSALYLMVADVTGDGVDDLSILELGGPTSAPAIHVFPQCEAHECGQ